MVNAHDRPRSVVVSLCLARCMRLEINPRVFPFWQLCNPVGASLASNKILARRLNSPQPFPGSRSQTYRAAMSFGVGTTRFRAVPAPRLNFTLITIDARDQFSEKPGTRSISAVTRTLPFFCARLHSTVAQSVFVDSRAARTRAKSFSSPTAARVLSRAIFLVEYRARARGRSVHRARSGFPAPAPPDSLGLRPE